MPIVLQHTRTTVVPERDAEFNRWYNEVHCPDLLSFKGAVSARRYRAILGEDVYRYMAAYEFQDVPTYERWRVSEHRMRMMQEFKDTFGYDPEPARSAWVQVWPE
jgi:antibiotic biosynthesis monooxygenase (ABM) superfamily enzyme